MPLSPLITLSGVNKVYPLKGGPFYALRNINLVIEPGEFVSIMGPSGSGKSSLLHLLGLHDSAWSGEYTLLGEKVHQLDQKRRLDLQKKHLGFVFQSYHLLDDLTIYENLEVPLSYRNVPRRERESIVCDMLDSFAMVAKRDLFPNQLSGGQQQLVGIARALIAKPSLLLADEPTGNLHSDQGREIMRLFAKLNRDGTTIVQVTHSDENASYGTRTVRLADGMIVG
ncbi:MAG TPA: ABC transporter ATP-binding protein [Opitutaceae bacterium]|jgi:putative ABC transport system ATP-binding protein|nr:ABC transporter ATP-binding protein [Opitutaceae bacterium]HRE04591.1 ABC transporter ATP-binding protein [Opitutaceae bacterium]